MVHHVIARDAVHPGLERRAGGVRSSCPDDFLPTALVEVIGGGGIPGLAQDVPVQWAAVAFVEALECRHIAIRIGFHQHFITQFPHDPRLAWPEANGIRTLSM
jgi:hypothetical protein